MTDEFKKLGLEDRVWCEIPGCKNQAGYFIKAQCCGEIHLYCGCCVDDVTMFIQRAIRQHVPVRCASCNALNAPIGWLTPATAL